MAQVLAASKVATLDAFTLKHPYVPRQFGGLHPHGANTLFVDGHVTFINEGAAARVWEDQSRISVDN